MCLKVSSTVSCTQVPGVPNIPRPAREPAGSPPVQSWHVTREKRVQRIAVARPRPRQEICSVVDEACGVDGIGAHVVSAEIIGLRPHRSVCPCAAFRSNAAGPRRICRFPAGLSRRRHATRSFDRLYPRCPARGRLIEVTHLAERERRRRIDAGGRRQTGRRVTDADSSLSHLRTFDWPSTQRL